MTAPEPPEGSGSPDSSASEHPPVTAPPVQEWRGVAAEHADEVTTGMAALMRGRSHRLLVSLLHPHKRGLWGTAGFAVLFNLCSMAGPILVQQGIDRGIPRLVNHGEEGPLILIVAIYVAVAIGQGLTDRAWVRWRERVAQDVLLDLRQRVFTHFQRLAMSFHERYTSGRVIARLTSDIDAISELFAYGLSGLVWASLSLVSVSVILLVYDLPLAAVALASFVPIAVATIWFRRASAKAYRATREAVALVIVHFVESLGGIRAVQAFRREPRNQAIFEDVNGQYRDANMWSSRLVAIYGPGNRGIGNVTMAAVLFYGGVRVVEGDIKVGVLAAFLLYLRRFFDPIQELSQFYNVFQSAAAALEKLSGVLEELPSVPEPAVPVELPDAAGEVRFGGVEFAYRPDTPVLHTLDLTIPAGQTVALVGATGAGKTTIARLIARFYDPVRGSVLLDGVDLRDLSVEDLRRAIVMVTQEGFLFSGTVADNIAFGRPGAPRADIEHAAKAIGAHDFIEALPDGYDTDVRKRGGRLSAGQRQLVAFARAFLADPRVLILDEATSSLDIPSERLVQHALRTLLADRTAVIIAHRLSTVEIADRVLVIDDGRVVEDGSPSDLVAGTGRYHDLHQAWLESLV